MRPSPSCAAKPGPILSPIDPHRQGLGGKVGWKVSTIGPVAKRHLSGPARQGTVLAAFRQSAYVRFQPEAVTCLCSAQLAPGPLNVLCPLPPSLFSGLRPGMPVIVDARALRIESHTFDLDGAVEWRPPEMPHRDRWCCRSQRHAVLLRLLDPHDLGEGFAPLLRPLSTDWRTLEVAEPGDLGLMRTAVPAIRHLLAWLGRAVSSDLEPPPALTPLIGLGPGLTPSGDDFLCGILVALHVLDYKETATRVAYAVNEALPGTNLISRAHLSCASEGLGSQAIHDAISGLLTCDAVQLDRAIKALGRTGHSSGWDGLAGVLACLAVLGCSGAP